MLSTSYLYDFTDITDLTNALADFGIFVYSVRFDEETALLLSSRELSTGGRHKIVKEYTGKDPDDVVLIPSGL